MQQFSNLFSPHNLRTIPRILLVLLILASFGMMISQTSNKKPDKVLGAKQISSVDRGELEAEIRKTKEVIVARPDYAGAWMRLSVLYKEIGEYDLAAQAEKTADNLATTENH